MMSQPVASRVAALIATALLAVLGACSLSEPEAKRSQDASGPPQASPTPSLPYGAPPDGRGVTFGEKGFSVTVDGGGTPMVSYGVIVENPSKYIVGLVIKVTLRSAKGGEVSDGPAFSPSTVGHRAIRFIYPGERFGLGGLYDTDPLEAARDVVGVDFEVLRGQWWPVGSSRSFLGRTRPLPHVTIRDVTARRHRKTGLALSFTAVSAGSEPVLDTCVQALFRDSSGKIVGGSGPYLSTAFKGFPPGTSTAEVRVPAGVPRDVDLTRIEAYHEESCL
ncbi:MAG: hypothetical protein ACRDT6_16745 [Micromonosporaceae bacterium]